ncbi:heat shock protein transcriptional repressor HspR [Microbacterium gorillae]|uniref:heat shock protein transcriptional repressor HspR n=1 Tax=Microbacterium gorillae TaxID=1231063 RepID=UPI00058FD989|nr:MerR family transcriptional regulator [Microbacterium gorillae]
MSDQTRDEDAPIFAIAVAAELAGMHPQTLRQYDRIGLVVPGRTRGGSRRYSVVHIRQLRQVAQMSGDGMSLPAIARIIELEKTVRSLTRQVTDLQEQARQDAESRPGARVFAAGATGSIITLRAGRRVRRSTEVTLYRPHPHRADPDATAD